MHKTHERRLRLNRVTAVFEDRALSFILAKGATLEELSDRLADLGRHNGYPVAITVKFGTVKFGASSISSDRLGQSGPEHTRNPARPRLLRSRKPDHQLSNARAAQPGKRPEGDTLTGGDARRRPVLAGASDGAGVAPGRRATCAPPRGLSSGELLANGQRSRCGRGRASRRLLFGDLGDEAVRQTATIDSHTLAGRTRHAAASILMASQHRQEDDVGLLDGQRGVDAISKGLHGPTDRRGPYAVDGSVVAADTLQLDLNRSRELHAVERKSRGGRVMPGTRGDASAMSSAVGGIKTVAADGRKVAGPRQHLRLGTVPTVLAHGRSRRQRSSAEKRQYFCRTESVGADGDAGEGQDSAAQLFHILTVAPSVCEAV